MAIRKGSSQPDKRKSPASQAAAELPVCHSSDERKHTKITAVPQSRGGCITVEQLNASQWHAYVPNGQSSGVGSYVVALNYGLLVASLEGRALQTLDRVGTYRTMMTAEGER